MEKSRFCPMIWLSGFFALGALAHLLRSILGVTLVVAGHEVPRTVSVAIFVIFGALSIGALFLGSQKPCCHSKHHEKNVSGEAGWCGDSH